MNKSIQERIAALQKEQEQLKARAQKLQNQFNAQEKANSSRRKYIVGALILKEIETNAALKSFVVRVLANAPARDKKAFSDLLPPDGAEINQS